jgi:alpha-beta hydrolase superfamily lysophospholipase
MMKEVKFITLIGIILIHSTLLGQKAKEVKVKTDHGKLYGTLVTPEDKKEVPVVLIIAGSGPTDRNGNSMMLQANPYEMLADSLVGRGIASLRYDKQGIGESAEAGIAENNLRFENMVSDVIEWIKYLKKKHEFSSITILGHSQGSLLGMLAAQEEPVDAYISLAGAGNSIDEILAKQLKVNAPDFQEDIDRILTSLKQGDTTANVPVQLMSIFRPSVQPFLISWIKYDPAIEITKVNIPTLIVQGTTDIQVANEEAEILANAKGEKVQFIEEMNHVLKIAPAEREENIKTYYDPKLPLHKGLTPIISDFIKNL